MLGHEITFQYCRSTTGNEPCKRIRDCWFDLIPIDGYIHQFFSDEQIQQMDTVRPPKTIQLFDLIKQAQNKK